MLLSLTKFLGVFFDNSYKIFHQKDASIEMLSLTIGTLCELESIDEVVEGWLLFDCVALLGCHFPIFTLFADHFPPPLFAFHFKAYCPFTKASSSFCIVISFIRFQIYHWSLCCPGKDHVCMLASKSWEPDCLCFSAGQSSKGTKRRNGSY